MNKRTGIIALIVLVVLVIIIVVIARKPKQSSTSDTATQTNTLGSDNSALTPTPSVVETTPTPTPADNTTGGSTTKKMSYQDALAKYGTNRIQLDQKCQAHPATATFKAGTAVMIDNRAVGARKVVFNGKTYNIAAMDYTVVTMTAPTYPAIAYIDCDNDQNVAKITIQK